MVNLLEACLRLARTEKSRRIEMLNLRAALRMSMATFPVRVVIRAGCGKGTSEV